MNDLGDLRTLWELFLAGGPLMWPITAMSLLVVAFGLERLVALRSGRFVPRGLAAKLRAIADGAALDPREVSAFCDAHPSVLATVVRAMLARIGRPLAEIEHAVETVSNREASRLYANIRPISLAVSITPLLGLLGTVQGMIIAFYTTANLEAGANRSAELAGGIYLALITTFAGLCVAIPAAVIAHYLEGRILSGCRRVDDVASRLLPAIERLEHRSRDSASAPRPSERQPDRIAAVRKP
ncbi:MAG: MotA/TolQ/ExbB proton channel family protein [Planctomycetota bacterium]|nr:MAG: MotA/TolQ/ExbB proton channel family protein [Planctomycetota bacterium]